jgi:hypothetical protein
MSSFVSAAHNSSASSLILFCSKSESLNSLWVYDPGGAEASREIKVRSNLAKPATVASAFLFRRRHGRTEPISNFGPDYRVYGRQGQSKVRIFLTISCIITQNLIGTQDYRCTTLLLGEDRVFLHNQACSRKRKTDTGQIRSNAWV